MKGYVGTNFGHGASAALVGQNGQLLFAAEEGKLSGDKESAAFPSLALSMVANQSGIDSYAWAEGWDFRKRLLSKGVWRALRYSLFDSSYLNSSLVKECKRYCEGQAQVLAWTPTFGRPVFVGHHLAHAWSLLPAGLPANSLIIVSDTTAESNSISSYFYDGQEMTILKSSAFPHSLGSVFHQLAYHVGFKGRTGPGKLMALSALGHPIFLDSLARIGDVRDGMFKINLTDFPAWRRDGSWTEFAKKADSVELGRSITMAFELLDAGADLAASAQAWFTESTWSLITQTLQIMNDRLGYRVKHLGLVGGAALNCKANGCFIQRMGQVGLESITVSPWSDDAGTAIGAAVRAYSLAGLRTGDLQTSSAYLGPHPKVHPASKTSDHDVALAVEAMVAGGVVGLVSGRLEFGPRALGGRSLVADPRNSRLRDKLNHIKGRPDFMPIAPAILSSHCDLFFEGSGSIHMAWTLQAREKAHKEIPAAVHRDGTSRVQVVDANPSSSLLFRLLSRFLAVTGCPALLLTSLNNRDEAVPVTLAQAHLACRRLGVDGTLSDEGWHSYQLTERD